MNHWLIVPILLPLLSGATLLLLERWRPAWQAPCAVASSAALLAVCYHLFQLASGGAVAVYLLGNWQAPFGIALALDRLGALMLLLTALLGFATVLYALDDWHERGPHFNALVQFQLMGLGGAFLTADLFNLFVFFEVLLAASYGLLLHGGGSARLRAGLHYVVLNLIAASLFLIGIGLLYALTGTLNLADLADKLPLLPDAHSGLLKAAASLLLAVFLLKAAILPLSFWLPESYRAASAPVAALFVVMTKLGVYAVLRVFPLLFGNGVAGGAAEAWLLPLAGLTVLLAGMGTVAARDVRTLAAYFVVGSAGFLLLAVGVRGEAALTAALFYLPQSTLAAAALFLLAERIALRRPDLADAIIAGPAMTRPLLLGMLFFALALALVGLPPMPGFFGKLLLLRASVGQAGMAWVWSVVLVAGACGLLAMSRAGSRLFWDVREASPVALKESPLALSPMLLLVGCVLAISVSAGSMERYANATARQLLDRDAYVDAVLGRLPVLPIGHQP